MTTKINKPLAVLCVGLGSVTTTFIAGVHAIRKDLTQPIGSLTQMERPYGKHAPLTDLLNLTPLNQLVFGAWDIRPDNAYERILTTNVLQHDLLGSVKAELFSLQPLLSADA